eukprot:CAMPEP_0172420532 /NCGR_PEP_ID=MMETSP1064-20121228/6896_1 /TAXON_ID=202472 /ORGANISM="Aulacoseira subarctica , Strain CCAP 1002/5" /LENGTH=409 /DNA_ID=CAMNT_0013160537 /DNA_START=220 /DNA_END=1446 /DNA_ORIENTATION=+
MWSRLKSVPIEYPLAFGVVISTAKTSFSDLLVQKVVERRENIDWKRNAAFATFGFFYLGGVQYMIYVPLFGRLFPNAAAFAAKPIREKIKDIRGLRDLVSQVFLDQCVHHPLLYFPAFYCTKELVMNQQPDIHRCLMEYKTNMKEDLIALWKVWVPSTLLNFAFMPMWARIPWVAGTSLFWTCILSAMRGGAVTEGETMVGGAVTGATMQIFQEGLQDVFSCPIEMDPNLSHFCVSASGKDQVGWVAMIAKIVADHGGNVTHSKMIRMGHDFIILMHISAEPKDKIRLEKALRTDEHLKPLNVRISSLLSRRETLQRKRQYGIRIHCVGKDQPGMLAAVAQHLSDRNISVENLTTELRLSRNGKDREFVIDAECIGMEKLNSDEHKIMLAELSQLKAELHLDVLDIRIH